MGACMTVTRHQQASQLPNQLGVKAATRKRKNKYSY